MSQVIEKLLTAEEFFDWATRPENLDRTWELEQGRIIEVSRAGIKHCATCWLLAHLLGIYSFQRGRGFATTNDCGIVVKQDPDTVRGPDLMYFDRIVEHDSLPVKWAGEGFVPALIVEVLSPNDRLHKTLARSQEYLNLGVPLVWMIDPELRSVSVYRANQFPQVLDNSDELVAEDILPGFRCRVSDLFQMPSNPTKPTQ